MRTGQDPIVSLKSGSYTLGYNIYSLLSPLIATAMRDIRSHFMPIICIDEMSDNDVEKKSTETGYMIFLFNDTMYTKLSARGKQTVAFIYIYIYIYISYNVWEV